MATVCGLRAGRDAISEKAASRYQNGSGTWRPPIEEPRGMANARRLERGRPVRIQMERCGACLNVRPVVTRVRVSFRRRRFEAWKTGSPERLIRERRHDNLAGLLNQAGALGEAREGARRVRPRRNPSLGLC